MINVKYEFDEGKAIEPGATWLPKVCGWNLLIQPISPKATTESGLSLPSEVDEALKYLTNVGRVLAMGPLCYQDKKFLVNETTCWTGVGEVPKVGDWVVYGRHNGQKIKFKGYELVLLGDDLVKMVTENPEDFDASHNIATF